VKFPSARTTPQATRAFAIELRNLVLATLGSDGPASTVELADKLGLFSWDINTACTQLAKDGAIIRLGRDKKRGKTAPPMVWAITATGED
jgi:biotin operon repressor